MHPDPPRPAGLEFAPDTLPEAQLGNPYSVDILVTRNETPMFEADLADGTLPPGLTIELLKQENAVRISGTPIRYQRKRTDRHKGEYSGRWPVTPCFR